MRSSEEQLQEIVHRSGRLRRRARVRRLAGLDVLCASVCLVLLAFASKAMPQPALRGTGISPSDLGSLILVDARAGAFVIGMLSFVLGVSVTLLAIHLRDHHRG